MSKRPLCKTASQRPMNTPGERPSSDVRPAFFRAVISIAESPIEDQFFGSGIENDDDMNSKA